MSKKTENRLAGPAVLMGVLAVVCWFYFWIGVYHPYFEHSVQKKHPITYATVTKVSDVKGTDTYDGAAHRNAVLRYKGLDGQSHTMKRSMPWRESVGQREPIVLLPNGTVYVYNQTYGFQPDNPRHVDDGWEEAMLASIFPWVVFGVIVGFLSYVVMAGIVSAAIAVANGSLIRLVRRQIRRFVRRIIGELKLQWEFWCRRQKRQKPSAVYRIVRRFQEELVRMDPTPGVIAARRQANELLTKVLERDNERVEVIAARIAEIRAEIDSDLQLRADALEELATKQ